MQESKPASKQVRIYQPTYQLNARRKFNAEKIEKILQRIIDYELAEVEYSEKTVPELTLNLAETIRNSIKEENYDRCRLIVVVTIGQRRQQGVHMFHSFLWDHERDDFASYNFENCHLFANVVVYGVYLD
ncbi:unnamed protein product [Chilo suppressalis]|uniref:Uncharacterized protein n=1 Tax=Chilo suppressalis TaxID=168631 RepID=A0ABN8LCP7_CHISP|nr:unnamed protein product [Chilo suppressalis]